MPKLLTISDLPSGVVSVELTSVASPSVTIDIAVCTLQQNLQYHYKIEQSEGCQDSLGSCKTATGQWICLHCT